MHRQSLNRLLLRGGIPFVTHGSAPRHGVARRLSAMTSAIRTREGGHSALAVWPPALPASVPRAHRGGDRVPGAAALTTLAFPGRAAQADRRRPGRLTRRWRRRRHHGRGQRRAADGPARALPGAVRRGRGAGRVLGAALLFGDLAGRARHGRPAQRRLPPRRQAEPRVLRDQRHRRGAVAPDHRHHAGAAGRRLQPVDGPAQRRAWASARW